MKTIDAGPAYINLIRSVSVERLLDLLKDPAVQRLVAEANAEYVAWDKFRRHPMPEGVTPEEAWFAVKSTRKFNPTLLPMKDTQGEKFGYHLPDGFLAQMHRIDTQAGAVFAASEPEMPGANRERFLVSSLMEEAIASSQLEGASTTRRVAKEMLRTHRAPRNRAEQMILNNYRTVTRLKELSRETMSIELLCDIQRQITEDTLPDASSCGRLRLPAEDDIAVYSADGEVVHQPPSAVLLKERLNLFCQFANEPPDDSGLTFRHPVITAIILHFWLAYEHPFVDGNGRTARAVFLWYMLKREYWLFEMLPISTVIRKSPAQYARAFALAEQDENDVSYFLAYNLRAINLALDQFHEYLRRKQREINEVQAVTAEAAQLNDRQRAVVAHALKNPGFTYTARSHMTSQGVSTLTARKDLAALARKGLLLQRREGKKDVWISPADLPTRLKKFS